MARAKEKDETEPETASSAYSIREREENMGIADEAKSQATTEREGRKFERKAKEEHPNAPEPVIGMNDERAQVSLSWPESSVVDRLTDSLTEGELSLNLQL